MNLLTNLMTLLAATDVSVGYGLKMIAAGIAVFTGFAAAIGEGNVAAHAVEAIGRQPEAAGTIRMTMIIGQAISETTGLYGFIIAILLLFM